MFDVKRVQNSIAEYYFKIFKLYNKDSFSKEFIKTWIELLDIYSKLPDFVQFESKRPILQHIRPNSKSVLIVPFENTNINVRNTTIFPLYPFRVQLKNRTICCKEGLSLLLLYLKITNINIIGFYKVLNYKKIIKQIKESNPTVKCYPPSSFHYFLKVHNSIIKL